MSCSWEISNHLHSQGKNGRLCHTTIIALNWSSRTCKNNVQLTITSENHAWGLQSRSNWRITCKFPWVNLAFNKSLLVFQSQGHSSASPQILQVLFGIPHSCSFQSRNCRYQPLIHGSWSSSGLKESSHQLAFTGCFALIPRSIGSTSTRMDDRCTSTSHFRCLGRAGDAFFNICCVSLFCCS